MSNMRKELKQLINREDLSEDSIREVGRKLGEIINSVKPVHPETIKHHWIKLFESGEVNYLYKGGSVAKKDVVIEDSILSGGAKMISIPVFGVADCGPATKVAEETDLGSLNISSSLLKTKRFKDLYVLKASGESMNQAKIDGHAINDGDYVIIDRAKVSPKNGDCVVAIVGGLANIKKYYREGDRVTLLSDSSEQFDPIFISTEDQSDSLIGGTVVQVVGRPRIIQ